MKRQWMVQGLLAAGLVTSITVPAIAQVNIYIGRTPPPLRYERIPPMPGEGYSWVDGYWGVQGNGYQWVPGRWERPPFPNAYWSHPHYDHYPQGWRMREGHWDREDHGDHYDNDDRKNGHKDKEKGHHDNGRHGGDKD